MGVSNRPKSGRMVNKTLITIAKCSFLLVVTTYGCLEFISQMCFSKVPVALLVTGLLTMAICYFRIPPPDPQAVRAVLGCSLSSDAPSTGDDDYLMKTVAHRGAGLDAPENSLKAFNLVSTTYFPGICFS